MPFTIQSGQSINLNTAAQLAGATSPLTSFAIGLAWEDDYAGDDSFDIDAMVLLLDASGQCTGDHDFIFYNQLEHTSGGVRHSGDDLMGGTIDETVEIHLDKLPDDIVEIAFIMSIFEGDSNNHGFDLVAKPTAFILSMDNEELCDYAIKVENAKDVHIAIVSRLKKEDDGWHFKATSTGFSGSLGECVRSFGINV